jgi:hypothetical protein
LGKHRSEARKVLYWLQSHSRLIRSSCWRVPCCSLVFHFSLNGHCFMIANQARLKPPMKSRGFVCVAWWSPQAAQPASGLVEFLVELPVPQMTVCSKKLLKPLLWPHFPFNSGLRENQACPLLVSVVQPPGLGANGSHTCIGLHSGSRLPPNIDPFMCYLNLW